MKAVLISDIIHVDVPMSKDSPTECQRQDIMGGFVDASSPYLYPCTVQYSLISTGKFCIIV